MKTEKIVRSLRWCGTGTEESCDDCAFEPQRDEDAVGCVGGLCDAAADKIEELVERCARYAEEIAVLREKVRPYEETGLTADVCAEYRKFEDEVVASGKTFGRLLELLRADCGSSAAMTNGGRIRAMTDEALAVEIMRRWRAEMEDGEYEDMAKLWCDRKGGCISSKGYPRPCTESRILGCIQRWLAAPAGVEA